MVPSSMSTLHKTPTPSPLLLSRRKLCFQGAPHVMGILNTTPDSFSDGGLHLHLDKAYDAACQMVDDGAAIIDIGGESTRPGAAPVNPDHEAQRVVPVIKRLRATSDVLISCDTRNATVAAAALEAGADLINDVSGFVHDPLMPKVVADANAGAILMHMRGSPLTMQRQTGYEDILSEIQQFLTQQIRVATRHGVDLDKIAVDPGIGFGKALAGNLALIRFASHFAREGRPVLLGPSRKRFIGDLTEVEDARDRDWGTAGAVAAGVIFGGHIFRVHNVRAAVETIKVTFAIKNAAQ